MDNTCKNCRYWKRLDNRYSKPSNFGECFCPKIQYGYSQEDDPDNMVFYVSIGGLDNDASLEVGQNFGCIHFKQI
jgi:hypothetical protein